MILAIEAGKYFSKKSYFISFQLLIVTDGKWYNHFLMLSVKENVNALSFTNSSIVPFAFMVEQIIWNSFICLFRSSPTTPQKVGNWWIMSDFNSRVSSLSLYRVHYSCSSKAGTTISLRVLLGIFIIIFSWLEWSESLDKLLKSKRFIWISYSSKIAVWIRSQIVV